jgi:hypothetical protein
MSVSQRPFPFTRGAVPNRQRVKNQISAVALLLVWCVSAVAARAGVVSHETKRANGDQHGPTLDRILDTVTESPLNQEGLDQSNVAIDQIVRRANRLIGKTNRERAKENNGSGTNSPLGQVLGQASLTLTDADGYLLKLKELQKAAVATQTGGIEAKEDAREMCKDLSLKYKAIWTDLKNLKVAIKTLPWRQRVLADFMVWKMEPTLISAIQKIRQRTIQVGTALTLEAELDLKAG